MSASTKSVVLLITNRKWKENSQIQYKTLPISSCCRGFTIHVFSKSYMACACFAFKILFAGRNSIPCRENVYIPADCQSWRRLAINDCSFAGKELEVNG